VDPGDRARSYRTYWHADTRAWLRDGDPYADFLPPAVAVGADGDSEFMRAVVFVTEETKKGTSRAGQEYQDPLLVLTGREYAAIKFDELHTRICDALRDRGP